MVISLGGAVAGADPHIRSMDARRDGVALADMLERAFADEPADEEGQAVLRMLRHFGRFDMSLSYGSTGFVWEEDGRLAGNASLMRNPAHPDTWVIGNVGTHPDYRGRGIATALVSTCLRYALARGGRWAALQVTEANTSAIGVYARLGFAPMGTVVHYARPAQRYAPAAPGADAPAVAPRPLRWSDRDFVWRLVRRNLPESLTWAETTSRDDYYPGLQWRLMNALEGYPTEWRVAPRGAIRARLAHDAARLSLELMTSATATPADAAALLEAALARFADRCDGPTTATQSRLGDAGSEAAHTALQRLGFRRTRSLVHMRAALGEAGRA